MCNLDGAGIFLDEQEQQDYDDDDDYDHTAPASTATKAESSHADPLLTVIFNTGSLYVMQDDDCLLIERIKRAPFPVLFFAGAVILPSPWPA